YRMNAQQIESKRQEIADQNGAWTAHNIFLTDDTYTFDKSDPKFDPQISSHGTHLKRIVQIVSDVTDQPLKDLRVLDLACLEGLYGIEFARHGAEVVCIEGREANINRARFANNVLGLNT